MQNKWSCPSCGRNDCTRLDEHGVWGYLCASCGEMHYVNPAGAGVYLKIGSLSAFRRTVHDTLPGTKSSS